MLKSVFAENQIDFSRDPWTFDCAWDIVGCAEDCLAWPAPVRRTKQAQQAQQAGTSTPIFHDGATGNRE